jgi:alpha-1,2-mannosyltransferase
LAGVLLAAVLGQGIVGVFLRDNDFLWHRHLGEAFLEGEPYKAGGTHYLPARTMLDAATAWLPYRIDRAVVYVAALAALAWTLLAWRRLADGADRSRGGDEQAFDGRNGALAAIGVTLVITAAYIQRDLDDCGLQLLLLFFLTAAAVALRAARPLACGFWLGLATAYKLTPVLFLPYLCWKGQWRAAVSMVAILGVLCLAPAVWLGWDKNQEAHRQWWAQTQASLGADDPVENGVEPPSPRNQALTLALARLVETYPPGHSLYVDHPLFAQFLDLAPRQAKRVVQGALLLFAGLLAWQFRGGRSAGAAHRWPREWAIVTLLTAILSPLCWVQHLVLALPAVFLVVRAALQRGGLARWQWCVAALAGVVMLFAGQRDLLGQGLFMVAMASKLHTWAALAVIALVLSLRRSSQAAAFALFAPRNLSPTQSPGLSPPVNPAA